MAVGMSALLLVMSTFGLRSNDVSINRSRQKLVCVYYWPSARSRWLDIGLVLFLRFYGPRLRLGPWKRKKRTRPISSHLDRTSLVNKRFIVWHKEHWRIWSSFLFIFENWKGTQLNAKVIARAPISWLDMQKYNHLIGYISNSNFKFSNSKQTLMFNSPVCAAKRIFKTYQHFCFLCFHSRWRFLWFHKDREVTKNLFTLTESNFSERKLSCTRLNLDEILFAGRKRSVPGGQYRSILPARVANQNTEFAAYCPLAELAI